MEIHGKLIGLMRERLMASLKQLPGLADRWAGGPNAGVPPSPFAQNLAKQLRVLSGVSRFPLLGPGPKTYVPFLAIEHPCCCLDPNFCKLLSALCDSLAVLHSHRAEPEAPCLGHFWSWDLHP